MPAAVIGGIVAGVGAIGGAALQSGAASRASRAQTAAADRQIAAQQAEQAQQRADFAPFREAGTAALGRFNTLAGLSGADEQAAAIEGLRTNPLFQSLFRQGNEAILQNASATGGLRGGNTQRSLADFGADTLARVYQQELGNLGGLINVGSSAVANNASLSQSNVNQQGAAMGAAGDAIASNSLAQGGIWSNALGGIGQIAGGVIGGMPGRAGGSAPMVMSPGGGRFGMSPLTVGGGLLNVDTRLGR